MNSLKVHGEKALCGVLLFTVVLLISPFEAAAQELAQKMGQDKSDKTDTNGQASGNGRSLNQVGSKDNSPTGADDEQTSEVTNDDGEDLETVEDEEIFLEETKIPNKMAIPLVLNDAVGRYIDYFSIKKKDVFEGWLKRERLYEPLVRQILREHGLPEDLIYLALIESGFNLRALSPMKAAGPWQFIPGTGKRYGLTVNDWIDERLDIQKSTVAAARYLNELFDQFDCWYLAAAAYNAGENRIDRLMKRHETKDFWQLRSYKTLPRETREYVPRLIAAAIIAKNPERYGLDSMQDIAPLEYVGEDIPGGVSLTLVAKAALTDVQSVRRLNPELRRGVTPPGKECRIKLPACTDSDSFQNALASILERRTAKQLSFTRKHQGKARLCTMSHAKKTLPKGRKKMRPHPPLCLP